MENVKSVEDENSALMHTQSELEMEILRLNGELAQARHSRSIHTGSSRYNLLQVIALKRSCNEPVAYRIMIVK